MHFLMLAHVLRAVDAPGFVCRCWHEDGRGESSAVA